MHGQTRNAFTARALERLLCVALALCVASSQSLGAREPLPQVSPEGLQLQKNTRNSAVYLRPGATFGAYKKVQIVDCYVEFAKNWQHDYNSAARGAGRGVRDEDMERIKSGLAALFKKVFTDELQSKGRYTVVDVAGPDVLVLRPALVNLRVNAPDLPTAEIRRTYVTSAGQVTLYLELLDSASGTLLARVLDAQADRDNIGKSANRVSNGFAAELIFRDWAQRLHQGLDAVRGT